MPKTVLFRCDGGPELGLGHVFRCCTLASQWVRQGGSSVMLGPPIEVCPAEFEGVFSYWQPTKFENEISDATLTSEFAAKHQANALVLDDYRIQDDYQLILKDHQIHWLQFDGSGDKCLWADGVINAMPGTTPDMYYSRLKNPQSRLLLGPDYALLRPEFTSLPLSEIKHTRSKRLFVFAGGGDDKQVLKLLIQAVLSLNAGLTVCAVTTSNNPGLNDLRHWINSQDQSPQIELHVDASDMFALMQSCGLAMVSAGTVTYEVNAIGLPMALFSMAQNQIAQAIAWSSATGARYIGDYHQMDSSLIEEAVTDMLEHIHMPVKQLVDGQGAQRVVNAIMEIMA